MLAQNATPKMAPVETNKPPTTYRAGLRGTRTPETFRGDIQLGPPVLENKGTILFFCRGPLPAKKGLKKGT